MRIFILVSSKTSPTDHMMYTIETIADFKKKFKELSETETVDSVIMGHELNSEDIRCLMALEN